VELIDFVQTAVNPFFGSRPLKRGPINIKEDFNPYKTNKVGEANIAGVYISSWYQPHVLTVFASTNVAIQR